MREGQHKVLAQETKKPCLITPIGWLSLRYYAYRHASECARVKCIWHYSLNLLEPLRHHFPRFLQIFNKPERSNNKFIDLLQMSLWQKAPHAAFLPLLSHLQ